METKEEAQVVYATKVKEVRMQEIKLTLDIEKKSNIQIAESSDSYKNLLKIWEDDIDLRERFVVIYLNRNNNVIGYYNVSSGGIYSTVVDPKLIFTTALLTGATGIILAHNHPSGNLKPSSTDIKITNNAIESGKLLSINILDHLIITSKGYYSFADEGLIK